MWVFFLVIIISLLQHNIYWSSNGGNVSGICDSNFLQFMSIIIISRRYMQKRNRCHRRKFFFFFFVKIYSRNIFLCVLYNCKFYCCEFWLYWMKPKDPSHTLVLYIFFCLKTSSFIHTEEGEEEEAVFLGKLWLKSRDPRVTIRFFAKFFWKTIKFFSFWFWHLQVLNDQIHHGFHHYTRGLFCLFFWWILTWCDSSFADCWRSFSIVWKILSSGKSFSHFSRLKSINLFLFR